MTLRILFAGVPHFAHALLDAGFNLRGIVLPGLNDDDETFALLSRSYDEGIPIWPSRALSRDATAIERNALHGEGPYDLLLVMNFHRLVPEWGIKLGAKGAWNVHPSLLPRHRGYNPYYWAIRSGDVESGVTVHHMTGAFDAGGIIAQTRVEIPTGWTSGHLWHALNEVSMPLLVPVLRDLEAGRKVPSRRQRSSDVTHDPRPDTRELTIDLKRPVDEVLRHIRAATPEPGAFLKVAGQTFVVRGAVAGPPPPKGTRPGDLFLVDGRAHVVVKQGSIRPFTVEVPGGIVDLADMVRG